MVEWQFGRLGRTRQRLAIEAAPAGRLEPLDAILAGQVQDAEARAEALLGVRAAAQDDLDQGGRVGADGGGFALDALVGPAGIAAMGTPGLPRDTPATAASG